MLENLWKHYLDDVLSRKFDSNEIGRRRPTFGVEHEFFIVTDEGFLATAEQSQKVFLNLAKSPNARVICDQSGKIIQVNFEHTSSRSYSAFKYEFFPHMLEAAFGFSTSDELLGNRIEDLFSRIRLAVSNANLKISSDSLKDITELSSEALEGLDLKRRTLHEGRKLLLLSKGADPTKANFPAFTAGTQVQVGGFRWWQEANFLNNIYATEIEALKASAHRCTSHEKDYLGILAERNRRYVDVYSGKILLGFPAFSEWTLSNWSNALSKDLKKPSATESQHVSDLAATSHDLSFIAVKPEMATLEFRGSPSQPDETALIAELKARIAQIREALESIQPRSSATLESQRKIWSALIEDSGPTSMRLA